MDDEEYEGTGCLWCNSKKHSGIGCKKRPKDIVDAYFIGQQQARASEREKMAKESHCAKHQETTIIHNSDRLPSGCLTCEFEAFAKGEKV